MPLPLLFFAQSPEIIEDFLKAMEPFNLTRFEKKFAFMFLLNKSVVKGNVIVFKRGFFMLFECGRTCSCFFFSKIEDDSLLACFLWGGGGGRQVKRGRTGAKGQGLTPCPTKYLSPSKMAILN